MEGLIQFTGIVIIAFGILQIILFFKVWGMTNNVKRIWKKIDKPAPDFNKYEEPKMYLL